MREQTICKNVLGQMVDETRPTVDPVRLKRERLACLQTAMKTKAFGALILFLPMNIRYAVGTRVEYLWSLHHLARYAVVPATGDALMYELPYALWYTSRVHPKTRPAKDWEFFFGGDVAVELARSWAQDIKRALKELDVADKKIGLDRIDVLGYQALEREGIEIADAHEVVQRARMIKTTDEVELLKISCAVADHALDRVRAAIRPGVREIDLFAIMAETALRDAGEFLETRLVLSGGNTNPWFGEASDRMVRSGDLVGVDTDMVGPMGYFNCVSRTYVCGTRPTREQKALYRQAYEFVQRVIPLMRPGVALEEVAKGAPEVPEEYLAQRYPVISHGCGLQSEYPTIFFEDRRQNSKDVLQENMVVTVEAYVGAVGGKEGVKLDDMVLITKDGPEVISPSPYDERLLD